MIGGQALPGWAHARKASRDVPVPLILSPCQFRFIIPRGPEQSNIWQDLPSLLYTRRDGKQSLIA